MTNWLTSPTGHSAAGAAAMPGFQHHRAVAIAARQSPGEWVDIMVGDSRQCSRKASNLKRACSAPFRPAGSFEVRTVKRGEQRAVQIRYVGAP